MDCIVHGVAESDKTELLSLSQLIYYVSSVKKSWFQQRRERMWFYNY